MKSEFINFKKSSWTKTISLNTKRHSAAALIYNSNLYVAGGATTQPGFSNVPLSSVEVLQLK